MNTEVDPLLLKLDLEALCSSHIRNKVRLDGRDLQSYRSIKIIPSYLKRNNITNPLIETSYIYGSSYVSIGNTIVICGINLMVGTPHINHPSSGDIITEISLYPGCKLNIEQKSKQDLAYELENVLNDVLMGGNQGIDLEQLCILKGAHAFRLCLKLTCISNDGNLMDAVLLAAYSSLLDLEIPEAIIKDDGIVKINSNNTTKFLLPMIYIPITIGLIDHQYILDPSNIEEQVLDGKVTIVFAISSSTSNGTNTDREHNYDSNDLEMSYLHQSSAHPMDLESIVISNKSHIHHVKNLLKTIFKI